MFFSNVHILQTNKSMYDFVLLSEFLEDLRVHISYEIKSNQIKIKSKRRTLTACEHNNNIKPHEFICISPSRHLLSTSGNGNYYVSMSAIFNQVTSYGVLKFQVRHTNDAAQWPCNTLILSINSCTFWLAGHLVRTAQR